MTHENEDKYRCAMITEHTQDIAVSHSALSSRSRAHLSG
jgi:hypothetical protein